MLSCSRGTISSEDVIHLSVCTPGLSGGASPACILRIDLPPASPDSGAKESGSLCGSWRQTDSTERWEGLVLTNCAGHLSRVRLRAEDVKRFYILPLSLRREAAAAAGCLLVFHSVPSDSPCGGASPPSHMS